MTRQRLARDTADQLNMQKRFKFVSVRFIAISQGIDSDSEQAQVLMTVHGMVDSEFIRGLSIKTHRGLTGAVLRGFSAGGACYGYRRAQTIEGHKIILRRGTRGKDVRLEIDENEAKIVRRIFIMAVEGMGLKSIAKRLTAEGIPPPQPREGRIPSWCWTGD